MPRVCHIFDAARAHVFRSANCRPAMGHWSFVMLLNPSSARADPRLESLYHLHVRIEIGFVASKPIVCNRVPTGVCGLEVAWGARAAWSSKQLAENNAT